MGVQPPSLQLEAKLAEDTDAEHLAATLAGARQASRKADLFQDAALA